MTLAGTTDRTHECGCCGRTFPAQEVAELGVTPGVFLCTGCGLSVARRATSIPAVLRLPGALLRTISHRLGSRHARSPESARAAIPILPSADLDRSAAFWAQLAFTETERHPGYLLLSSADTELHLSHSEEPISPGTCFIHVGDTRQLWEHLKDTHLAGIGQIRDTDYGLREFVATDPDGNRIRFGSPIR